MTKATHNGTCQACGRSQAVTPNGLAKHGYTTAWGYFSGTCSGSDRQPLELETSHNVDTVAAIRNWADQQEMFSNGNIETVSITVRDPADRYGRINLTVNLDEYIARRTRANSDQDFSDVYTREFEKKIEDKRAALKRAATSARKDADLLDALRDKTFGNDLEARDDVDAPQPQRESFSATKLDRANAQAYDKQRQLKEQGIRSRVTGDARYATITWKA